MSFRGSDPYGTPGGVDAADKATDPADERLAVGRVYVAYLRVNEAFKSVTRQSVEAITRVLAEDLGVLVAVIIRDNGTIVDNNVGDIDAGLGLIVSQTAPGVVVIDVGAGQISTTMLADALITAAKMANNSVGTANLIDRSVTEAKLALLSVGTPEIIDDSVTTLKIAPGAVDTSALGLLSVDTAAIQDLQVTTAKLADNSVTTTKIVDGTIVGADIAALTIANGNIANTTITGSKLVNDTITSTQIAANAVTASELADNAVDTAAIVDASVTPAKLSFAVGSPWAASITAPSTSFGSTAVETAFDQTIQIPANTVAVGDIIRVIMHATTSIVSTPTFQMSLRLTSITGTVIWASTLINPGATGVMYIIDLVCRSIGTSGQFYGTAYGHHASTPNGLGVNDFTSMGQFAMDTTGILKFVSTGKWNSSVANACQLQVFNGYIIRPT